jgi:L-rhamnose mutarotase
MFVLLTKLKDVFIEASCDYDTYVDVDANKIEDGVKSTKLINSLILEVVTNNISPDIKAYLDTFLLLNNKNFKAIIDGGNVLYSNNGKINKESLNNLIKIIELTKKMFGKSLLVIHRRHTKTFPNLISELKKTGVTYYLTPYNVNDDIFILWFFLNCQSNPYIITNDKYRDHIFNFETSNKKDNINLSMSQFKHLLTQQSLEYDITYLCINKPIKVSKCIHLIENKVYVPHVSGKFIEIIL